MLLSVAACARLLQIGHFMSVPHCEADVQKHAFARTSPVRPSRPWHARRCTVHLSIVSSTAAGHGFVQLTFSERRVAWSEHAVQRQT